MKIRVESAFVTGAGAWVGFSCALGRGEARWNGVAPEVGREYFVELELDAPIDITHAMAKVPLLDATREEVKARGCVSQIVAGLATIRLGDAGSLHLAASGLTLGGWVALRSGPLTLFDQNL